MSAVYGKSASKTYRREKAQPRQKPPYTDLDVVEVARHSNVLRQE